ncbi:MAG: hypothetical protein CMG35_05625 [Candidatus Marinimicrobia bacterium]|jgi:hypothetical protein|nr:hypothetical protein [Candidatus Neomarinimicrobiota bacterium]|tara:strand:+ start:261 stop:614 length:354 start_codon:yes stop_codon:yes gene_type:complete
MKTFTIVGKSTLSGVTKNRVANGTIKARTAVLARNGHTNIQFVELPEPMAKPEAIAFLEAQEIMTPKFEDVSADILAREAELDQQMEDASVGLDVEFTPEEEDSEMDFNNKASSIHY